MTLDDLISNLFQDVASPSRAPVNGPGEMVRQTLAGNMPGFGAQRPAGGNLTAPAMAGGPRSSLAPVARSMAPAPSSAPAAPPPAAATTGFSPNPLSTMSRGYSSGGLFGAIGNLFEEPERLRIAEQQSAAEKAQAQATTNMTVQAVMKRDPTLTPQEALIVAQDKDLLRKYFGPGGPGAGAPEYGTTVQYAQGEDGKVRAFVVGKDGSTKYLDLEGGATPLGPEGIAAARARGGTTAKTLAEAKAALPKALDSAGNITAQLQSLESDPYFETMVGSIQGRLPNLTADANRVQSKMDQLQGGAFLQAFQSLKGGGQITEIEGKKATDAITRLGNQKMDENSYREAINELKLIARNSIIRAQIEAGVRPPEDASLLHDFEGMGLGDAVAPSVQTEVGIPTTGPVYNEVPQAQGVNPRSPGYRASAGAPVETRNPRAPGYKPGVTLDAGNGFQVRVK